MREGRQIKLTVRYVYDALGRRVARNNELSDNTKFTYDGADVLLDQNADGTTVKYLNGQGIDTKLRQTTSSGQTNYFLSDHLGSTNALVNTTGAITSQTNYDGFGNQTGNLATRYGYTGRERDSATGLMHYRARQYSPELGRFISEDPIGFAGGDVNLYGYVWNNSVNMVDPTGNEGLTFFPHGGSYGASGQAQIKQTIESMINSQECRKSFTDAGLTDPLDLVNKGLFIGPVSRLHDMSPERLGITQAGADDLKSQFASSSYRNIPAAGTLADRPGIVKTADGRPRIFFSDKAFGDDLSFLDGLFGYTRFKPTLGHELMHAAGQPARFDFWYYMSLGTNDLAYFPHYNNILKSCGCN